MADDDDTSADVSALMEALWGGPPREAPAAPVREPSTAASGGDDVQPDAPPRAAPEDVSGQLAELRSEVHRLAEAVAALSAMDAVDLDARLSGLRAEMQAEMGESVQAAQAKILERLSTRLGDLRTGMQADTAEQVRGANEQAGQALSVAAAAAAAVDASTSAREAVDQQIEHKMAELATSFGSGQADLLARLAALATEIAAERERAGAEEFAALRSELREALSRQMIAADAELQRRAGVVDAFTTDAKAQLSERLHELAGLVRSESTRAAEYASAQATQSVGALREQLTSLAATVAELQELIGSSPRGSRRLRRQI